ncbi:hypothetical protein [Salipiger mucosus]|uniref:Uncharacterized protein n=1 Tax=Salipiger mucosus DSM 16094 TaxID=1123237 RepID=S9Q9T5_9RHOB|nr:hypothetical protein [Salipiger mucosus]EPX78106.1 hypothetical protein Salmuc_03457 [Salipiger mucosus DSM 16094]
MATDFKDGTTYEQRLQATWSNALAVVERDGVDGEIRLAREAFKEIHWLRRLSHSMQRRPFPPSKQTADLAGELELYRRLSDADDGELIVALSTLIDGLRNERARNFRLAGKRRPTELLTPAQMRVILNGEEPRQSSTLDALERKNMISYESGRRVMTGDARTYAWQVFDRSTYRMLEKEGRLDAPLIQSNLDLLELMYPRAEIDPEVSIYVYRGSIPMVVRNGDGQNPLAYLHRYFLWEIEVDRTCGDFLEKREVSSHKGSYEYRMQPQEP